MLRVEVDGCALRQAWQAAVKSFPPVHQSGVIPHDDIAWPPVMRVDIFITDQLRQQRRYKLPCLRIIESIDAEDLFRVT